MTAEGAVHKKIQALAALGEQLVPENTSLQQVLEQTAALNGWFDKTEMWRMLESFRTQFLNAALLEQWMQAYTPANTPKTIGLVLAGNVPFVGMHDLLCVLMSGHRAQVKLSSKDPYFFLWMQEALRSLHAGMALNMGFAEKLTGFDAVIATGSNNSARYFEYYFGKYPHIIRRNRTSIAILTGNESPKELEALGKDVFYYYGLGCRNVGKIFAPAGFDRQALFRFWEPYRYVIENTKYKHNFDYNRALLLLNKTPYLTNDFYMLVESDQLFSPLSVVYFTEYADDIALHMQLEAISDHLQCVISERPGNTPFGESQFPGLSDYADHVDTMQFLTAL